MSSTMQNCSQTSKPVPDLWTSTASNVGVADTNQVGELSRYGAAVWYHLGRIANILLVVLVCDGTRISCHVQQQRRQPFQQGQEVQWNHLDIL